MKQNSLYVSPLFLKNKERQIYQKSIISFPPSKISLFLLFLFLSSSLFCEKITILTWNISNAFDVVDDPTKNDTIVSPEKYADKINLTAGVLKKYQPDFAALCEVENKKVLKELAERAGYPYYYLEKGNDPRGINVALLSTQEVKYQSNKNQPTPYPGNPSYKFSRDCPSAEFETGSGNKFYLLITHLKSNFRDDGKSEMKREAQVKGILDIIENIYASQKEEPFILLTGDLNSVRYSSPLRILEKSGLYILNYLEKQEKFYTYIYKKEKQDLDYMVVNRKLYKKMKKRKLSSIQDKMVKSVSDHFPILLEFELE